MTGSSKFFFVPFLAIDMELLVSEKLIKSFTIFFFWKASIVKDTHTLDITSK